MTNLHGNAKFNCLTAVNVGMTYPELWDLYCGTSLKTLWKNVPFPYSYPDENSSALLTNVGEILPVHLALHPKRRLFYRSVSYYGLDNPASILCRSIENIFYAKDKKGLWVQQTPISRMMILHLMSFYVISNYGMIRPTND
jgi:hypothetical protein